MTYFSDLSESLTPVRAAIGTAAAVFAPLCLTAAPQPAQAETWTDTIRYDVLCGDAWTSTCGEPGRTGDEYFTPDEPYVSRMAFALPDNLSGSGQLDLWFFGDYNAPGEFLDLFLDPPSFIDAALVAADHDSSLSMWSQPGFWSCVVCSLEVAGETYAYHRLMNRDPNDDRFEDDAGDVGNQWYSATHYWTTFDMAELADYAEDGVLELAFVFNDSPDGGYGVQGNPFTDYTYSLDFFTQEQLDNMEYNWLEATLTLDVEAAATAVPAPPGIALLLSGLLGAAAMRRRRS